jgi:hypothetical protein
MEEPFGLTLWTFGQVQDHDRIKDVLDMRRQAEEAGNIAAAFHEPKRLGELDTRYKRAAGLIPSATEARNRAKVMIEKLKTAVVVPPPGRPRGLIRAGTEDQDGGGQGGNDRP